MQVTKSLVLGAAVALSFTACKNVDFKKTSNGVPYKVFESKSGTKVAQGDFVKFQYKLQVKDSVLNSSYDKMPGYQQVAPAGNAGYLESAINEVVSKSKKGDSILLAFTTDSIFARDPMTAQQMMLKKNDKLNFTLKIIDIFKKEDQVQADYTKEQEAFVQRQMKANDDKLKNDPKVRAQMDKDSKLIEDYLKANNIQAQKVGMGTYVQVINPGTEPKIAKGKFVTMFYTGSTLKGKQFETNVGKEPATFQMAGRTIKGFEEGLMGLGKGGHAKIFIPSMLAYGEQARSEIIGAYENLIFDVQVVDVTDTPPAPAQAPQMPIDSARRR